MNAHEQAIAELVRDFEGKINIQGTRNVGKALARTEWFREVLAFALQERLGKVGGNIIMSLVEAGESTYMKI